MQPLTQDPFSPQERFENAVKVLKHLAASDDSDPPFDRDKATDILNKPAKTDAVDIARAAGQEGPKSDLTNILNDFEFSLEEAEERERSEKTGSEKTCSNRPVTAGRKGGPRPALPGGSSNEEEKSSASTERVPDRKDLPSLKIVVGMITLAQIAAAIILGFALVSWLSVHPLDSFLGPQVKGLVERPPLAKTAMNDASDAIPTGIRMSGFATEPSAAIPASNPAPVDAADVKGRFSQPRSDLSRATRLADAESLVLRVSVQPVASYPAPALPGADETRSTRQDRALVPGTLPASNAGPHSVENSPSTLPVDQAVGRETLFDDRSVGAERPDAASAQAPPSRSLGSARPPAPEKAESPGASAARAAAASLRDRAEAEIRKLSIRQDLRQALRSRAAREWQTKLAQSAVRDLSASHSEPVSAATDLREQHVLQQAEVLLRNSDIDGARLVLERAAADGSGRAVYLLAQTYDPGILQDRWSIRDVRGDPVMAQNLYLRAQAAGVQD
jgi:hypothetical protein